MVKMESGLGHHAACWLLLQVHSDMDQAPDGQASLGVGGLTKELAPKTSAQYSLDLVQVIKFPKTHHHPHQNTSIPSTGP